MDIINILKTELKLSERQVKEVIKLIDEDNTIPFIARYRKEATGNMSDVQLREFGERLTYLRNLESRKEDVIRLIDEQEKLDEQLEKNIKKAKTLQEVEDLYAPYKKKKRTRAIIAKEKGLESFANKILLKDCDIEIEAEKFINIDKKVENIKDAIKGAMDIIAETMSDNAEIRKYIRKYTNDHGMINTKNKKEEDSVYKMYYEFSEGVSKILPHRILAINRGEKEGFLTVKLEIDNEKMIGFIENQYTTNFNSKNSYLIRETAEDAYKRLIYPSIEREIRNSMTEVAQERAIKVFGSNLKGLLLQAPIKDIVVMGFDPALRTGCKIAIVDKNGKFLDYTTVFPTAPQHKVKESKIELKALIEKYNVDIISIGNGTASRESEQIVAKMIKEIKEETNRDVQYVIVSEAGASVYSASKLATEEHPDINVSIRGAISIARRLQDPLAELVKIEPKSIGVGQYQHDVNAKRLEDVLDGVVEDSVNKIGVDLNTASYSLLGHIAGINKTISKNIVDYRDENGEFKDIKHLKKVKRLGDKAFKQAAGFLRISDAKNPLDNTGVHPESYKVCKLLLEQLDYTLDDVKNKNLKEIDEKIKQKGISHLAEKLEIGKETLKDIVDEIKKPGRDPRDSGIKPILKSDVMKLDDIKVGMILKGTVRNVVDFGAFVDIGIKNDGLVHVSKITQKFITNPAEVLTVGDIVDVKVIDIDTKKARVSLSIKDAQ